MNKLKEVGLEKRKKENEIKNMVIGSVSCSCKRGKKRKHKGTRIASMVPEAAQLRPRPSKAHMNILLYVLKEFLKFM